jgi:apolipoprotein N-acyltransferase
MWMLSFVPDAWLYLAVYIVLASGIGLYALSFFTRFIPPLIPYSGILRIFATILLIGGVYFYGGYSTEMQWRAKVADLETKVAKSEAESKEANTVIQKVYIDRVKVVKDTQLVIQKQIVEVAQKIDSQCVVAPEAIDILNLASKRPEVKK